MFGTGFLALPFFLLVLSPLGMKLGIPSKETTREGHSLIPFLSNQPILRDRVAPGRCGTPPPARTPSQWQEPRRCRPPAASPEIESQASAENPPLGITKVIFQHLAVVLRDPPPFCLALNGSKKEPTILGSRPCLFHVLI